MGTIRRVIDILNFIWQVAAAVRPFDVSPPVACSFLSLCVFTSLGARAANCSGQRVCMSVCSQTFKKHMSKLYHFLPFLYALAVVVAQSSSDNNAL